MSEFTPKPNCIPLPTKRRKDKTEEAVLPTTDYWGEIAREWLSIRNRTIGTIDLGEVELRVTWEFDGVNAYQRALQQYVHNTANPPVIRTGYINAKEAVWRMRAQQEEQRTKANDYYRQVFGKVNVNND